MQSSRCIDGASMLTPPPPSRLWTQGGNIIRSCPFEFAWPVWYSSFLCVFLLFDSVWRDSHFLSFRVTYTRQPHSVGYDWLESRGTCEVLDLHFWITSLDLQLKLIMWSITRYPWKLSFSNQRVLTRASGIHRAWPRKCTVFSLPPALWISYKLGWGLAQPRVLPFCADIFFIVIEELVNHL